MYTWPPCHTPTPPEFFLTGVPARSWIWPDGRMSRRPNARTNASGSWGAPGPSSSRDWSTLHDPVKKLAIKLINFIDDPCIYSVCTQIFYKPSKKISILSENPRNIQLNSGTTWVFFAIRTFQGFLSERFGVSKNFLAEIHVQKNASGTSTVRSLSWLTAFWPFVMATEITSLSGVSGLSLVPRES